MQKEAPIYISVCVPTYNRTDYIQDSLLSALSQSYEHFEVLVSDDSEHDKIRQIAASFNSPKLRYFKNQPPLGLIPKLNWFLNEAKGEWVVILCDDDRLEPGFLKTLATRIANNPDATLARTRYRLIDENGLLKRLDPSQPPVMDAFEATGKVFLPYRQSYAMNITGVLFKKEILRKTGGFLNLYDGLHVDRLAWASIGAEGSTVFENQTLCSIRIHSTSMSGNYKGDYESRIKASLEMRKTGEALLAELAKKVKTESDAQLLEEARRNLDHCVQKSLQAGFDKGFRVALSSKENSLQKSNEIFSKMHGLGVPLFRSAYIYRVLSAMPYAIRSIFMEKVHGVKLANFSKYLQEKK